MSICHEQGDGIRYYNRYTQTVETEAVYGEWALRVCYGSYPGRLLTALLVSRPWVSRIYGWWMRRKSSTRRIRPFMEKFGIDSVEFASEVEEFTSFNDFFVRRLKPISRPIAADVGSITFPADGRHFGWERIGEEQGVFVKGQKWDIGSLLGNDDLAKSYAGGTLVLSRLCPIDYHHFHYPVAGRSVDRWSVRGKLYSVSPLALRIRLSYFWENYRVVERFQSSHGPSVCLVDVGATNVGSIQYVTAAGAAVAKGERRGWFEFGGSSVVTLFPPNTVCLSKDLIDATHEGIELYARMGDVLGSWKAS
jgi:phosphatidylserine decarboxylase